MMPYIPEFITKISPNQKYLNSLKYVQLLRDPMEKAVYSLTTDQSICLCTQVGHSIPRTPNYLIRLSI